MRNRSGSGLLKARPSCKAAQGDELHDVGGGDRYPHFALTLRDPGHLDFFCTSRRLSITQPRLRLADPKAASRQRSSWRGSRQPYAALEPSTVSPRTKTLPTIEPILVVTGSPALRFQSVFTTLSRAQGTVGKTIIRALRVPAAVQPTPHVVVGSGESAASPVPAELMDRIASGRHGKGGR